MLNCIPPTKESLERIERSTYCGASSNYKPTIVVSGDYAISPDVKSIGWKTLNGEDDFYICRLGDSVATKVTQFRNPTIAVTSNSDISSWNTNADVVFDNSTDKLYFLDEAGCITEDAAQDKSITWAKTKDGHKVMLYDASQIYQKNDMVEKDGWVYQSNIDDNVWTPDTIESRTAELWTEITRLKAEQAIHSQLIDYVNKGHLPPIHRYDWWEIE